MQLLLISNVLASMHAKALSLPAFACAVKALAASTEATKNLRMGLLQ
jgi:hypothetical protein